MRSAALCIALAMLAGGVSATRAELVSARVGYSFSLAWAPADEPLAEIHGGYKVELVETCEGWSFMHDMVQRAYMRDGGTVADAFRLDAVESRDGRRIRFDVRTQEGDEPAVEASGTAEMGPQGGRLQRDDSANAIDLPAGTLFPIQFTFALIEQARSGTAAADYRVLSGAFERPWAVRVAIEPAAGAELPRGSMIDPGPLSGRSWRVRATGQDGAQPGDGPGYAVTAWMFESGVVAEYLYDYGRYGVRARLERLEVSARPTC
jgi:hypothetical protein